MHISAEVLSVQNKKRFRLAHMDIKAFAKSFFVPLSLTLPILALYILNPSSFELTWKGRFLYLFFLWLFFLEIALVGGKLPKNMLGTSKRMRALLAMVIMAVPTAYVIAVFPFGLDQEILELGRLVGVPYEVYGNWFIEVSWPLSFEYLFFTAFFAASVLLTYGVKGLKRFSVSLFFLGAMGASYMIDTFYPYGTLIVLQSFVPFTASSAANILNWMGYETQLFQYGYTRYVDNGAIEELVNIIHVSGENSELWFAINWPCAGVQSLFIYTFVIMLFLKEVSFSTPRRIAQAAVPERLNFMEGNGSLSFLLRQKRIHTAVVAAETFFVAVLRRVPIFTIIVVGAVGTFIVNVLRVVSIFLIGVYAGPEAALTFHSYYGELYFIAWIMLYLFAIVFGPKLLAKLVKMRRNRLQNS